MWVEEGYRLFPIRVPYSVLSWENRQTNNCPRALSSFLTRKVMSTRPSKVSGSVRGPARSTLPPSTVTVLGRYCSPTIGAVGPTHRLLASRGNRTTDLQTGPTSVRSCRPGTGSNRDRCRQAKTPSPGVSCFRAVSPTDPSPFYQRSRHRK